MVRVFVGPVLRVRGRIGTSAPRGGSGENWVRWLDSTTTKKNEDVAPGEDETRLGRSPPCSSPLNYPDFTLPMGRTPGRDGETRGKSAGELELAGARRILRIRRVWFLFFFRGAEFAKGRARSGSDAGSMNRRARGHDAKTISSPCRPLNRPRQPDGTTLHYYDLKASTRRFQINERCVPGYFHGCPSWPSEVL